MSIPMNICWECGEERPDEVVSEACLDCIYEHAARLDESICERAGIEGPYFTFSKSSLEEDLEKKYLCGKVELCYATVVVVGGTTSSAVIQMLTLGEILDIHYSGDEGYDEIVLANEVSQDKGRFSYESPVLKKAALEIQEEINRVGNIDNSNSIDFEERFLPKLAERLIWEDVYPTKEVEENHTYFLENMYDNLKLICKYQYPRFAFRNHEKGYIEFICKDDATLVEILQKKLEKEFNNAELRAAAIFFLQEEYGITYGSSEEEKKFLSTVISKK